MVKEWLGRLLWKVSMFYVQILTPLSKPQIFFLAPSSSLVYSGHKVFSLGFVMIHVQGLKVYKVMSCMFVTPANLIVVSSILNRLWINPNTFAGLVGKVRKKLSPEGGRKEKKSARSAPAGPGARTRDLPRARRGSPAARHGGCLDKQAFPCL